MTSRKSGEKFVVIGNGVAGYTAAYTIKQHRNEAQITMISKEPYPLYSACGLANYLAGEIPRETLFLEDLSCYEHLGILPRFGESVIRIDTQSRKVVLNEGIINYDKLILATGSKALRPPIEGINHEGILALKSIADADNILKHDGSCVAVIGSGPIGIEAAIAIKRRGLEVFLIESMPRLLPRLFDQGPSRFVEDVLTEHGIKVFCGELVSHIFCKEKGMEVVTREREISCDFIILAAGMVPNIEITEETGINIGVLNGISVDDKMRTSVEGVYACGDCVETWNVLTGRICLSLLWHCARQQGRIAGLNASGIEARYPGSVNYTGVDLFGVPCVSLGVLEDEDHKISAVEKRGKDFLRRFLIKDNTLIGIQVIGDMDGIGVIANLVRRKVPFNKVLLRRERDFVNFMGLSRADLINLE